MIFENDRVAESSQRLAESFRRMAEMMTRFDVDNALLAQERRIYKQRQRELRTSLAETVGLPSRDETERIMYDLPAVPTRESLHTALRCLALLEADESSEATTSEQSE